MKHDAAGKGGARYTSRLGALLAPVAATLFGAGALRADPLAEVVPATLPGPFPVACSNVEQDFGRVPPGQTAGSYWRGLPTTDTARYVTDLLIDPANALVATFTAPDDSELFGRWSGQALTYAIVVCYPTSATNGRADYPLPNGVSVPRMQRGAEAPIFPENSGPLPVVVFSHGYGGSAFSDGYFDAITMLASFGYVTAASFHGDFRYSSLGPGDTAVVRASFDAFENFVAMQSVRPLSVSATLDLLGAHPQWRDRVDLGRVGGFGISQGGETMMLIGGAQLTTSLLLSTKRVTQDSRIRAAVGYIPYFGLEILPAFGRDQRGVDGVSLPYLAISGTDDFIAPIEMAEAGVRRLGSSRHLVAIEGLGHELAPEFPEEILTWALIFMAAHVLDDRSARVQLQRLERVAEGYDDRLRIDYVAPASELADERVTVEFYNASLDHYFITSEPAEAEALDQGVPPGWQRTGLDFKTWVLGSSTGSAACRFFGTPGVGPNSHFFTIDSEECAKVKGNPAWTYEGLAFQALPPGTDVCASGETVVTRLYNNGMGGEANHRYLTSHSETQRMVDTGWIVEGPVFCAAP